MDHPSYKSMTNDLLSMLDAYQGRHTGYAFFLFNSHLNHFLYTLYQNFADNRSSNILTTNTKHKEHLVKAIDYITNNYKSPISLKEIASHLSINPEYFCRIFKKNMGFTFLEYLNQIRLVHIYEDLTATDDSITDILGRHGFSNYKVFSRMFKESYGCKPSDICKQL